MTDLRYLLAIYVHAHQTGNSVPPHIDAEARAALADEPAVPDGREPDSVTEQPSDGELNRLLWYEFTTSTGHGERTDPIAFARAVLARWGNPAPQPVPVSERLPGPEDCDANGRCWWWYPEVPGKTYGYWAHEDDAVPERAFNEQPLHWLPAHALPLPGQEVEG